MQTRRDFLKHSAAAIPFLFSGSAWAGAEAGWQRRLPSSLALVAERLPLIRRSEWTGVSPERRHLRLSPRYDRITLHHAGNGMVCAAARSQIARDLQGVLTAHLARGYGDIGYHFVVDYNGRVWEGRSLAYEGAHVLCENERNIGIMLLGNFEKQKPSPAQVRTIAELVPLLRRRWRIRRHRIYGHCDLGQSICPGRNLYSHVARMRA